MSPIPLDNFFHFLFAVSIWSVIKLFVCFGFLLYIIFAAVVVKQVNLMTEILCAQFELPLKIIAAIHLVGTIFIFILAIIIL